MKLVRRGLGDEVLLGSKRHALQLGNPSQQGVSSGVARAGRWSLAAGALTLLLCSAVPGMAAEEESQAGFYIEVGAGGASLLESTGMPLPVLIPPTTTDPLLGSTPKPLIVVVTEPVAGLIATPTSGSLVTV